MTEEEVKAIVQSELQNQGTEVSTLPVVQQMDGVSVPVVNGNALAVVPLTAMQKMAINRIAVFGGGQIAPGMSRYNMVEGTVNTATVNLPTVVAGDTTVLEGLLIRMTTGDSPSVTWRTTSDVQPTITCMEGFSLQANTTYEISAIWDGLQWTLARSVIVALP